MNSVEKLGDVKPDKTTSLRFFATHRPFFYAVLVFVVLWSSRVAFYIGPLHDEAITMLAAKGMERQYADACESGRRPFGEVVPALIWHKFTSDYSPLSFGDVHDDLLARDIHPPLAFWVYNLWLSLFRHGAYQHAVVLSGIEILLAGLVVYWCLWRLTADRRFAGVGALLLYMSNSALFTATYIRQYALLSLLVALSLLSIVLLLEERSTTRRDALYGILLGSMCLAGMLTQYLFAIVTMPLHLGLVLALFMRRSWRKLVMVLIAYGLGAGVLCLLTPEIFLRAMVATSQSKAAQPARRDATLHGRGP